MYSHPKQITKAYYDSLKAQHPERKDCYVRTLQNGRPAYYLFMYSSK